MCEYVDNDHIDSDYHQNVSPGYELDVGGMTILNLEHTEGFYWECWHPETEGWEAMYPPPEGMGLYMTPGSKVRLTEGERPEETRNAPPPERIEAGTKMRDLARQN